MVLKKFNGKTDTFSFCFHKNDWCKGTVRYACVWTLLTRVSSDFAQVFMLLFYASLCTLVNWFQWLWPSLKVTRHENFKTSALNLSEMNRAEMWFTVFGRVGPVNPVVSLESCIITSGRKFVLEDVETISIGLCLVYQSWNVHNKCKHLTKNCESRRSSWDCERRRRRNVHNCQQPQQFFSQMPKPSLSDTGMTKPSFVMFISQESEWIKCSVECCLIKWICWASCLLV